jgi:thiol-disulfide isomerase/thioredoxin
VNFQRARWVLLSGAVLAALIAAIALRDGAHLAGGKEGERVGDFTLPRITANGLDRAVLDGPLNHRGKPFLLHFWAPSCAPCRAELPLWQELAQHGAEFTVLTVAVDPAAEVSAYLAEQHFTLPTVWDETGEAQRELNVWGIPRTFAISRTGVIVRDLSGAQTHQTLQAALRAADLHTPDP